jgi:hypothetical protein
MSRLLGNTSAPREKLEYRIITDFRVSSSESHDAAEIQRSLKVQARGGKGFPRTEVAMRSTVVS